MTKRHISVTAIAIAGAALGLSACSTVAPQHPTHLLNPVTVAESVERLELYARPDGLSLSARDQSAVNAFLAQYAAIGTGGIYINRPAGHEGGLGVQATDRMLQTAMASAGLNPAAAQGGEYYVRPGDPAPVVVSYKTLRTVPQDCMRQVDLSDTRSNGVTSNFGCVASANMAAMIQDPRQLIAPLPRGVPNAQRRQVIYDRYIQGQATGAARPAGQEQSSQESGG